MTLNTSEVLDLSKENIQPLRQGRKAAHLKTALQAQIDPEVQQMLQKQREQYEYNIRMYEGEDPLEPYYNYVIWLEQSFPKMGRESNLIPLLEDILIRFKDCEKYKQDHRLVQLLVKYISVLHNPLEIYQLVYNQGLGTMCSLLYKAWAEEFDKLNDIKKADQIYQLGISCRAQPLEELQNAHMQFQLSIARRMIEGRLNSPAVTNESSRTALSKLQLSKIKTSRISKETAGVLPTRRNDSKVSNFSVPKFQVYQEDGNNGHTKSELRKCDKFPKGSVSERENIMQPSKWCGQKQKQSARMSLMPSTPSFQIHEDPGVAYQMAKSDFRPRALKIRREEYNIPVAVFEPADPTKKTMYPKHLVYVGGRDVQLEEIRAGYYWKKIAKESKITATHQITDMDIILENVQTNHPKQEEVWNAATNVIPQKLDSFVKVDQDNLRHNIDGPTTNSVKETCGFDSIIRKIEETPEKTKFDIVPSKPRLTEKNIPDKHSVSTFQDKHNVSIFPHSPSTSMTVNTRAAHDIVAQMWESPLSKISERTDEFLNAPANKCPFPIYIEEEVPKSSQDLLNAFCDENVQVPKLRQQLPFEVYSEEAAAKTNNQLPFEVYSDEHSSKPKINPFAIHCGDPVAPEVDRHQFNVFCEENIPKSDQIPVTVFRDKISSDLKQISLAGQSNDLMFDSKKKLDSVSNFKDPFVDLWHDGPSKKSEHLFKLYCDDDDDDDKITHKTDPFALDCLARPLSSLKVTVSESTGDVTSTPLPLIVPVNLQDTPLEPENKENRPPKDYSTPSERRPLSGILTPATNVSVNENPSDDSDDEDYQRMYPRSTEMDDETCSTKAFAIPLPASTPFSRSEHTRSTRKSLIYDGSYIADENNPVSNSINGSSSVQPNLKTPTVNQLPMENSKRANWMTPNLSLILENSKETGGLSSSSGNTGSKTAFLFVTENKCQ